MSGTAGGATLTTVPHHLHLEVLMAKPDPIIRLSDHPCECGCGRLTSIARQTRTARGEVIGQTLRFFRGHSSRKSLAERFWIRVDRRGPDECWPWLGYISPDGYGHLWDGSENIGAHRISWRLANGPTPAGKELDHLCRHRSCVNPGHLEPVTTFENIMRGESPPAINARKACCPNGHAYKAGKFSNGKSYRHCPICSRAKQRAAR